MRLFIRSLGSTVFFIALTLLGLNVCLADFAAWSFNSERFEARLFQDWLLQDAPDADVRAKLFKDVVKNDVERALVERVFVELEDSEEETLDELRARLARLLSAKTPGVKSEWRKLYRDACLARREARLSDVKEQAPKFVYTKHYVFGASHYAYTEDVSDEESRDYSSDKQPGGQLCLASFQTDGSIAHEVLVETEDGTIRDPDVSWDGSKVLFSMRKSYVVDDFHIYEYDVATKTTRQITFGDGVADIEPIYLLNGDILFTSTRCMQITDCSWSEVVNLYTCDAQGRFLRRVSVDQVSVNYPKLLDDGRVIYTRWDYNDRGQIFPQPLFQMNADGTGQTEFYGNNSYFPTSILHARGIPGGDKVVAIAAGHHVNQHGKLILIDRSLGTQEASGVTLIAPIRETLPKQEDHYGQVGELFQYPYPLDDETLLTAYLPEGALRDPTEALKRDYSTPFGVYWFNFDGRRELLAFDPEISCGQPIPLTEREKPVMRPSQVDLSKTTGKFYIQDVYEGSGLSGVPRGTIKSLRVVALEFRAAAVREYGNEGPAGVATVSTPVSVRNGTWDVKRVLGVAPVEEDGSAYFEVPALTPCYFQLLDKNGDCVQTMRSWSTLQPGETFGCVGCHESKGSSIGNSTAAAGSTTIALRKGVATLTPELTPGKGRFQNAGFSFVRDVQPILDRYCVNCHSGKTNADGSRAPFSLRGDLDVSPAGNAARKESGRFFSESYLRLTEYGRYNGKYVRWLCVQEGPEILPPYKAGAVKSPLIAMFRDKDGSVRGQDDAHRDVQLDERSLRILAMWIDLLVPYCGDYVEQADWTKDERATYEYYLSKQVGMKRLVEANMERKRLADEEGLLPETLSFGGTDFGGKTDQRMFMSGFFARRVPSAARRIGKWNVYRNLALNLNDTQEDAATITLYPHASSNSEFAYLDECAAKNAIDGKTELDDGGVLTIWKPNLRDDLWFDVDFGCDVEIDKAVVYVHGVKSGASETFDAILEFSDGSRETIDLKTRDGAQEFHFAKRRVKNVRLSGLTSTFFEKAHGIAEIEFWGVSL